ncbi:ABC transporter ATP-binding protein [Clostridium sp. VAP51]|uniref:ABC transporter ATP-binding protein n=1 Tax=Clostridium sp. VAP51 TaxID=2949978 RepID=UPI00207939D1|nr:ABC transporter ATP-binding protein [Clostridium sp. VAP51]
MKKNIIKVINLNKNYKIDKTENTILHSINLDISQGEMIAIMGTSGSGKSTLLNILACIDNATSGDYILDGKEITKSNKKDLAKIRSTKIGMVFQNFNLIPDYTVYDNIKLALLYKCHHEKIKINYKKVIMEHLKMVGLDKKYNKYPSQLSGGEQQRIAIARTLAIDPLIILADEPTGSLDEKNTIEILRLFKNINDSGKTLVIVTHDRKVADSCMKILKIEDGYITHEK